MTGKSEATAIAGPAAWPFRCIESSIHSYPGVTSVRALLYVRLAFVIARPVGVICALFGVAVLLGYLTDAEILYRPIQGGPATNPMTALTVSLLGLGLSGGGVRRIIWPQIAIAMVVATLTVVRLLDVYLGSEFTSLVTPFQSMTEAQLAAGKSNSMGENTAWMLLLLSLALIFNGFHKPTVSQACAFIAMALPMVSFTGYAYGIENFYGQMSMITATIGFALSLSAMAKTAHRGILRAILSPYIGGRIARVQIVLGYVVPFALGFLLVRTVLLNGSTSMFGLFVVAISWFIIVLVTSSAVVQERVDHRRRMAERSLVVAALNDQLTNLPNRRHFFQMAQRELDRSLRMDTPDVGMWLLMIDIDHFKTVNDTAGHAMGDKVLNKVGRLLADTVRGMDFVARVGGEEFAVLLPSSAVSGVIRVAEAIRERVEQLSIRSWTEDHGPITVSIGCAPSMSHRDLEALLAAADEALYQAKNEGRNRTVVSGHKS